MNAMNELDKSLSLQPESHQFYPYNIGPIQGSLHGKPIPRWIELSDGSLYAPVDLCRAPVKEHGERIFARVPNVVYRLVDESERSAICEETVHDAGNDHDLHRAQHSELTFY